MKAKVFTFFFFFSLMSLAAQDDYHAGLADYLNAEFGLTGGDWVIGDEEAFNLGDVIFYGCTRTTEEIEGQDFSRYHRLDVPNAGNNPWDAGWKIGNNVSIGNGHTVLLTFWLRSESGEGSANVFVERNSDFVKDVYLATTVGEEWTQYFIPFTAEAGPYGVDQASLGFHLATQEQVLHIAGFTAINYGTNYDIVDLPNVQNNENYGGYEADAPWRAEAAERIETLRKTDLTIRATTSDGTPIENGAFDIQMERHAFGFGSAVNAARFAGNNSQNAIYESKIHNLDGNGHGFNEVVFENDMKWDGWEEMWFVNHEELYDAVDFLAEKDIRVRGHVLVWPGFQYLPDDIAPNANNPDYVWDRVNARLEEMLDNPNLEGKVQDWDVLNEIVFNTDFEPIFDDWNGNTNGREIYTQIIERAKEIAPEVELYYNDYVTMTLNNFQTGPYNTKKARIQEMLDAGAPLDGVGFQAHIGGTPNSIYDVLGTMDDFYDAFGLKSKITEFDLPGTVNSELAANYLRDFMTAIFSHESCEAFLFWSFWDNATWMNPGANLFDESWNLKPTGETFIDLVFNEWWTNEQAVTNANGVLSTRVFKGLHEITYVCNGETITETVDLTEVTEINITCDNLQTNTINISTAESADFNIFPNPASDFIYIEKLNNRPAVVRLSDVSGKVLQQSTSEAGLIALPVSTLQGVYFVEIEQDGVRVYEKVVVR